MGPHSIGRYIVLGIGAGIVAGLLVVYAHLSFTVAASITGVLGALAAGVGTRTGGRPVGGV